MALKNWSVTTNGIPKHYCCGLPEGNTIRQKINMEGIPMKLSDILTDESKWCKWNFALDADNKHVPPNSDLACKFCLGGAMVRLIYLTKEDDIFGYSHLLRSYIKTAIKSLYNYDTIVSFNDDPRIQFCHIKKVIEVAGV